MKQYRLLKDLPTFRAGQLAYVSSLGNLMAGTPEEPETADTGLNLMIYHRVTLEKFPNILTEWFEKIEPTDSIHWKPKKGEKYWISRLDGDISYLIWSGYPDDYNYYDLGRIYRTEEECEKARDRELAEVRLRRTSNFKPDFENGNGGWIVCYDHKGQLLFASDLDYLSVGDVILYSSKEDAEKSIKENREDWLIYFGVKEREDQYYFRDTDWW